MSDHIRTGSCRVMGWSIGLNVASIGYASTTILDETIVSTQLLIRKLGSIVNRQFSFDRLIIPSNSNFTPVNTVEE